MRKCNDRRWQYFVVVVVCASMLSMYLMCQQASENWTWCKFVGNTSRKYDMLAIYLREYLSWSIFHSFTFTRAFSRLWFTVFSLHRTQHTFTHHIHILISFTTESMTIFIFRFSSLIHLLSSISRPMSMKLIRNAKV